MAALDDPKAATAAAAKAPTTASNVEAGVRGTTPLETLAQEAKAQARAGHYKNADELLERACEEHPTWTPGYLARLRLAQEKLGTSPTQQLELLEVALRRCKSQSEDRQALETLRTELSKQLDLEPREVSSSSGPPALANRTGQPGHETSGTSGDLGDVADASATSLAAPEPAKKVKLKGVKLLPHEEQLLRGGQLVDVTHAGASAIWLSAPSKGEDDLEEGMVCVYRPMGDLEFDHLQRHGVLPATQPYQTIVIGDEGRVYAEKYLRGHKSVDSAPTTVVEFVMPEDLIAGLFKKQSKNEDGAISHGLGNKGGNGLPVFNEALAQGLGRYRVVFVKRFDAQPRPKGMGGKKSRVS